MKSIQWERQTVQDLIGREQMRGGTRSVAIAWEMLGMATENERHTFSGFSVCDVPPDEYELLQLSERD